MRTITNYYRDSQVLNLGSEGSDGPYLVTQTGVSPTAAIPKTRMFVLRPDGCWVDLNAYVCQGNPKSWMRLCFHRFRRSWKHLDDCLGDPGLSICQLMKRD